MRRNRWWNCRLKLGRESARAVEGGGGDGEYRLEGGVERLERELFYTVQNDGAATEVAAQEREILYFFGCSTRWHVKIWGTVQ